MTRRWTFSRQVAAGFAVVLLLAVVISVVSVAAIRSGESSKQDITHHVALLGDTERLRAARTLQSTQLRDYALSGDRGLLDGARAAHEDLVTILAGLTQSAPTDTGRRLLEEVARADSVLQQQLDRVIATTRVPAGSGAINDQVRDLRLAATEAVTAFVSYENQLLDSLSQEATRNASLASTLLTALAIAVVLCGVLIAFLVARGLRRQVGTAVSQIQSSATQLEGAAQQQAVSAKEEATAMAQITTTMNELLATSRQIAESAQRVSQIAEQTAAAARSGEGTVNQAHESVAGIQRQVSLIVEHMLELGGKSQQIGAVLDIVTELAEQTNILAINATIEAAGAGESGARFAVVADEIRNLADRVSGSAKETRDLIDEIRGAVNTTVMATETGSKTVEDGSRQFAAVADSFRDITSLVATTAEAAREIELSTNQQTTAVEQTNAGISSVAQTTRETESGATQTRQTAAQLATLSTQLLTLVDRQPVG